MDDTTQNSPEHRPGRLFGLRHRSAAAFAAAGLLTGGLLGGYVISRAATATSTATPAPSGSAAAGGSQSGTFHSNEDPTHEAGESAAREAQENAGQFPTVP